MSSYHVTAALASERHAALLAEAAHERLARTARQAARRAERAPRRSPLHRAVLAMSGARR